MESSARWSQTQRVGHEGRGGVAVQVFAEKDQVAVAGPYDLHAHIGSDEGRGLSLSEVLPAGVVDGVGVGRIVLETTGCCSNQRVLTSEIELADAHLLSLSHGFGVTLSCHLSSGDGLFRLLRSSR